MNCQHIQISMPLNLYKTARLLAWPDGLATEFYQKGGTIFVAEFMEVICKIWDTEEIQVPQVLQNANIVTIFKRRGDKPECGNWRGISLLSIVGKVLSRILLTRLSESIAEDILPESQMWFCRGRNTWCLL